MAGDAPMPTTVANEPTVSGAATEAAEAPTQYISKDGPQPQAPSETGRIVDGLGKAMKELPADETKTYLERLGDSLSYGHDNTLRHLRGAQWVMGGGDSDELAGRIADGMKVAAERQSQRTEGQERLDASIAGVEPAKGFWETTKAVGDVVGTAVTEPGAVLLGAAESAASMEPSLAGGVASAGLGAGIGAGAGSLLGGVGAIPGAATGAGVGFYTGSALGTTATEMGAELEQMVGEKLQDAGKEPTKENIKAVLDDKGFQEEAMGRGLKKGLTLAAIDALTMKLGGKIATAPMRAAEKKAVTELAQTAGVDEKAARAMLNTPAGKAALEAAKPGMKARTSSALGGVGVELAGEPVSEAASQAVARDEVDWSDVAAEGVYGAGTSVVGAGIGGGIEALKMAAARQRNQQGVSKSVPQPSAGNAAAVQPSAGLTISPSAPGPQPTAPQPSGPLSRAVVNTEDQLAKAAQAQPEVVTVTGPNGQTVPGFLAGYQEDGQGGFTARVLGADGQTYQFTDQDGVTIQRQGQPAAGQAPDDQQQQAPSDQQQDTKQASARPDFDSMLFDDVVVEVDGEALTAKLIDVNEDGVTIRDQSGQIGFFEMADFDDGIVSIRRPDKQKVAAPEPDTGTEGQSTTTTLEVKLADQGEHKDQREALITGEQGVAPMPAAGPVNQAPVRKAAPASIEAVSDEQVASHELQSVEQPVAKPPKAEQPAPQQHDIPEILGKDGQRKWFGSKPKAMEFITSKGLGDTHEIRKSGPKWEIHTKQQAATQPAQQTESDRPAPSVSGEAVTAPVQAEASQPEFGSEAYWQSKLPPNDKQLPVAETGEASSGAKAVAETKTADKPQPAKSREQVRKEKAQRAINRSVEAIGAMKGDQVEVTGEVGYAGNNTYTVEDIDSKGNVYLKSDSGRTSISPAEIQGAKLRGTTFTKVEGKPAPAQPPVPKAKKKPAPEASANKVFTEDAAEKARALLRSKLGQVNSGVDPEVLQAGIVLSGYHIEKGARTFVAYAKAMLEDLGEVARPYLKSWYLGAKFDPRAAGFDGLSPAAEVESFNVDEVELDVPSTAPVLERDDALPENAVGEAVGATQGSGSLRGSERAVDAAVARGRVRPVDGSGVPATSPLDAGTPGDQRIPAQDRQPGSETGVARTSDPRGNRRDGRVGIQSGRRADTRLREKTQKRSEELTRRQKQQAVADQLPVTLLDPDNIKATLPLLSEHQQLDVLKAERRLYQDGGKGMLLTNGTGTGKTYSGLGLIKRVIRRGGDVLIVSPAGVISAWEKGAKDLGLTPARLKSKRDAGKPGLSITSYQNFRDNQELMRRNFDLVVYDESHHLMSNMGGDSTSASLAHKAMTGHPDYELTRGSLALQSEFDAYSAEVKAETDKLIATGVDIETAQIQVCNKPKFKKRYEELTKQAAALSEKLAAEQQEKNTKVLFLSASPFAGHKSVFYTDGYLFDSKVGAKDSQAYNTGSPESQYLVTNFGYRMRYNRVTQPGPEVEVGLLERDWADRMFQTGAMSGRKIELDFDYSREFVTVAPGVGAQIDKAFEAINWKEYPKLAQQLIDWRKGGSDRQLTEALRVKASLDRIAKHIAMGRKVVVFHERQRLNIQNPFHFKSPDDETRNEISRLKAAQPWIFDIDLGGLLPAPIAIGNHFGDRVSYFSGQNKSTRDKELSEFNLDSGAKDILVIQKDAGKEGLSAHDITGEHPRVLMIMNTPVSPADAIQMEGRTYRHGLQSDAIIEYPTIQTSFEKTAYRETVSTRTSTAENLAMGSQARNLREAFREGYLDPATGAPHAKQGTGGRKADSANDGISLFDRAKTYYFRRQKKTGGNKAAEGTDYFATPEPLGMKMVEWANLEAGEKALEPSGGHGAIARWLPESATNLALEPSPELVGELGIVTSGDVRQMRFEDLNLVNKFHAVVMNPPFGRGGATAIEHIGKAVDHLKDGGRVIAIYPKGPAADAKFNEWFEGRHGVYLVASIDLPAVTFNRAGTSVATRIVVLDKDTRGNNVHQGMVQRELTGITDINELFERIEHMELPARPDITVTGRDVNLAESTVKNADGQDAWRATMTEFTNHGPAKEVGLRDVKRLAEKFNGEVVSDSSRVWKTTHFDFATEQERERFFAGVLDASEARIPGGIEGKPERFVRFSAQGKVRGKAPAMHMTKADVETQVTKWLEKYRGVSLDDIQIHESQAQMEAALDLTSEDGVIRRAAYDEGDNTLHVVAENVTDARHLRSLLRHEIIAHYGLARALGGGELTRLIARVIGSKNNPSMKEVWDWVEANYPDVDKSEQAEEVIAHLAELEPSAWKGAWERIASWLMGALRRSGFMVEGLISKAELSAALAGLGKRLQKDLQLEGSHRAEKRFNHGRESDEVKPFASAGAPVPGISLDELKRVVEDMKASYNGNIPLDIRAVERMEEIYGENIGNDTRLAKGAYHPRARVAVFAGANLLHARDARETFRHEILGHYGLNTFTPKDKEALLRRIIEARGTKSLQSYWDDIDSKYANLNELRRAEEVFAAIAEDEGAYKDPVWREKVLNFLNRLLRKIGLTKRPLTLPELRDTARAIARGIRSGVRVQQTFPIDDGAQFSLSPEDGEAIVKAATQGIELEKARNRDQLGSVIADQGKLSRWFVHPRTIAAVHPEFTPVYKTAIRQMEARDANVEELGQHLKQYNDLPQKGKMKVNQVLELGRLLGEVYTKEELEAGFSVPAAKEEGGSDSEGNPVIKSVPINPLLSKAGDTITLTEDEAKAYRQLRTMFDTALDKFRDQVLEEYGFPELVGKTNAGQAILDLIEDTTPEARVEALTNMGRFISEIEQAKRTGYVPFARYGDYVVTVKEKVADLEFVEDSTDAYIVKGVTDEIAPRVAELGGVFVKAESGWRIPKTMRQEVKRLGEKTVYSEMVEPGITGKFYERRADNVADIPEVKKAIELVRKEWVGDNEDRRIVSFKPRDKKPTDPVSLTDVDALASVANIDNATWDAIRDKLSDAIKGQSFRRHFFQSSNVPGYTGDFERAMSDYVVGMSGYLSRRGHMKRWDRAVSAITDKSQLFDYASKYRDYVNNPQEEFAMTRQIGFLWYIAGVTATAIANLTQVPLLTVPTLAQIAPTALVLKEIGRAYKDALAMARPHQSGLDIFDPEKAPEDVRDILKKAWAEGVFVPLETYELMTIARQRNTGNRKAARTFNKGLQGLSYLFTFAERLNRLVTYMAAARIANKPAVKAKAEQVLKNDALAKSTVLGRNWSPESLAEWAVDESQYRMGKANRPTTMRGVGAVLMQFKSYIIQTFEAWYRMGALHDQRGKYALASSLALLLATSGIWGAPGADDLRELVEEIYRRITGKDLDMRTELRGWIMRNSGSQYIANAVNRGVPYTTIGMDLSGRVGMGGLKPDRAIDVLGPTMGIGSRVVEGLGKMADGDVSGGALNMLPNLLKHPLTAAQWSEGGLRDKYGKTILPADKLTSMDLVMKVMGFQPTIATDVRDYDYAQSRQQSAQDDLKRRFVSELARSLANVERAENEQERSEAEDDVAEVIQSLKEYNEKATDPSEVIRLSPPAIRKRVAEELHGWKVGIGRERKQARGAAATLREEYGLSEEASAE